MTLQKAHLRHLRINACVDTARAVDAMEKSWMPDQVRHDGVGAPVAWSNFRVFNRTEFCFFFSKKKFFLAFLPKAPFTQEEFA